MTKNFHGIFGNEKPVIAMVAPAAPPGLPYYDQDRGLEGIVEAAALGGRQR